MNQKSKHIPMAIFRLDYGPPPTIQSQTRHPLLAGFLTSWCDMAHSGRGDKLRCGTVTDLFSVEVKQKKWRTGVQWDTVASYPVDFTHTQAAVCTHLSFFQWLKTAGEPAGSFLCTLYSLRRKLHHQRFRLALQQTPQTKASTNEYFNYQLTSTLCYK